MAGDPDIQAMSATELVAAFLRRDLSPVEAVDSCFAAVSELDSILHTFVRLNHAEARASAKASEERYRAGCPLSDLDGVPLALKDLFDTAGVPTEAGFALYAGRTPAIDSSVVRRLYEAGAVSIGKLRMWELAANAPAIGTTPLAANPWDTSLSPGGSSSGASAAVAARLIPAAIGSDTGGSIRTPASVCGIVGFKPTAGLIELTGTLPVSWNLDHAGPMTRTVRDAAALTDILAGTTSMSSRGVQPAHENTPLAGVRIAAPFAWVEAAADLEEETYAAYCDALDHCESLGATVLRVHDPALELVTPVFEVLFAVESYVVHQKNAAEHPEAFNRSFLLRLALGSTVNANEYAQALRAAKHITTRLQQLLTDVDVMALPTRSGPAKAPADEAGTGRWANVPSFRTPFNITGQPALSLPCGLSSDRLPIGLQFVGAQNHDTTVLRVAEVYEQSSPWHTLVPPVSAL